MRVADRRVPVEVDLWRAGTLDRLPAQLGHRILEAWQEDLRWIVAMSDLGSELLDYGSIIDRGQSRPILGAAHAGVRRRGDPAGPPARRPRAAVRAGRDAGCPGRGQSAARLGAGRVGRFDRIVPADVCDAVRAIHDRPERLTEPLIRLDGATLLHGDYWLAAARMRHGPDGSGPWPVTVARISLPGLPRSVMPTGAPDAIMGSWPWPSARSSTLQASA